MSEPHICDYLNITKVKTQCTYTKTRNIIKKLKAVSDAIDKANKAASRMNPDDDEAVELIDMISDISWDSDIIDDAIDVVNEYEDFDYAVDELYAEIENRLTDDEKEEFEQEKVIHKLKGE